MAPDDSVIFDIAHESLMTVWYYFTPTLVYTKISATQTYGQTDRRDAQYAFACL